MVQPATRRSRHRGRRARGSSIMGVAPSYLTARLAEFQLIERVEHALRASTYRALWAIQVTVDQGAVRLDGSVPSYYLKLIAQERAMAVLGVKQIRNSLVVADSNESKRDRD